MEEDGSIIYEPHIAAMVAMHYLTGLPRRTPRPTTSCSCARASFGSDPSSSPKHATLVAFSRGSFHKSKGNFSRQVYWLLRGMEVQSYWLPNGRRRKLGFASRRHFDTLCASRANDLISALSTAAIVNLSKGRGVGEKEEKQMSAVLRASEDVLEGVSQDEVMATALTGHVEAHVLQYAVEIALADAK